MAIEDDVEQRWVSAWNDVYEIAAEQWNMQCQLPDGQVVDAETCRSWLQRSVYQDWLVKVEPGWVQGKPGIIATRWKPTTG